MQICSVLSNNVLLSDYYKKKWFKTKVAQTSVIVEYTKSPESIQKEENDVISNSLILSEETPKYEEDFIFIRKFATVAEFIKRVSTLDTVLENIESFSLSVYGNSSKSSSAMTPGAPTPGNSASIEEEKSDVIEEEAE